MHVQNLAILLSLTALLSACKVTMEVKSDSPQTASAAPPPAATPPGKPDHPHEGPHHGGHHHGDGHPEGHGQGAFVHDFSDAEAWSKRFDDPARDAWQKPNEVIALMGLKPGMLVADIGAGTGYFEPYLSKAVGPTGTVWALDVEDTLVAFMRKRAAKEGLTNVRVARIPFDSPNLPDGKVDRVLIVDTWHHIGDRGQYSAKLAKALAPGGQVVIVDFGMEATEGPPKEHRVAPEKMIAELAEGGLVGELATETLPQQYVMIARLK